MTSSEDGIHVMGVSRISWILEAHRHRSKFLSKKIIQSNEVYHHVYHDKSEENQQSYTCQNHWGGPQGPGVT